MYMKTFKSHVSEVIDQPIEKVWRLVQIWERKEQQSRTEITESD